MIRFFLWKKHRRGLLAWTLGGFFLAFFYGLAYLQAAGTTLEQQLEFGRVTVVAAKEFAFLIPVPVHPETLGGYEQFKWLAFATDMMIFWAALVGVGVARGDEDKGLTEEWLAFGVSRTRYLVARSAAFLLAATAACFGATLGVSAVAPFVHQDANLLGEIGKAVSMTAAVFCAYTIALLIAQLPAERQTGTALGVGAMVLLLVVNGVADTVPSMAGVGVISPFHWLELTTSAAPGGKFDVAATMILLAAAIVLLGASFYVFQRRDLGSGVFAWAKRSHRVGRVASRSLFLRAPWLEGLWEQRVGLATWAVSMLVLGSLMAGIVKPMADTILSDKTLVALFERVFQGSAYAAFLGFIWFSISLLVLAAYAVVQVSRWSAQDQEGRVEMLLSAPVSRSRLVIDRAVEFALASLVIIAAGYIGVVAKLPSAGLGIGSDRVLIATALLWPFTLAFGGLGVAVASRWPRLAVPGLAAFVVVEFFLGDLAPLFKAPDWIDNLSVFHLYGNPLVTGFSVMPVVWMALVFVAGFGAALVLMQRRDVAGAEGA